MLGESVPGGLAQTYCGGGSLSGCQGILISTLKAAAGKTAAQVYPGDDLCTAGDQWCADSIVQRMLGGIKHPSISWQNRSTYQQVVEYTLAPVTADHQCDHEGVQVVLNLDALFAARGSPPRSLIAWILEPGLPQSTELGPVRFPFDRPYMHGVDARPGPVDLPGRAEDVEYGLVDSGHHARRDPLGEPAVRPAQVLRATGNVGLTRPIKERTGRTTTKGCQPCDALQGNFFIYHE